MKKIVISKARFQTEDLDLYELEGMMHKSLKFYKDDIEFYTEDNDGIIQLLGTLKKDAIFLTLTIKILARKLLAFLLEDKNV